MLRKAKSLYVGKRSDTLLKVKTFFDAEAKVIGYEPGKVLPLILGVPGSDADGTLLTGKAQGTSRIAQVSNGFRKDLQLRYWTFGRSTRGSSQGTSLFNISSPFFDETLSSKFSQPAFRVPSEC